MARKKGASPTSLRSIRLTEKPALPDSAVQCDVLAAGYRPWRWPKKSLQKCRWRRRHLPAQASGKIKRRAGGAYGRRQREEQVENRYLAAVPACGQQNRRNGHAVRHLVNDDGEKYDRTQLRQNQTRAESNSVQKTVKGDAEESPGSPFDGYRSRAPRRHGRRQTAPWRISRESRLTRANPYCRKELCRSRAACEKRPRPEARRH